MLIHVYIVRALVTFGLIVRRRDPDGNDDKRFIIAFWMHCTWFIKMEIRTCCSYLKSCKSNSSGRLNQQLQLWANPFLHPRQTIFTFQKLHFIRRILPFYLRICHFNGKKMWLTISFCEYIAMISTLTLNAYVTMPLELSVIKYNVYVKLHAPMHDEWIQLDLFMENIILL